MFFVAGLLVSHLVLVLSTWICLFILNNLKVDSNVEQRMVSVVMCIVQLMFPGGLTCHYSISQLVVKTAIQLVNLGNSLVFFLSPTIHKSQKSFPNENKRM